MLSPDTKARNFLVERGNLVLLCRFTVKTVLDKASVRCLEEESDDVTNLIAAVEQVLNHGIRKVRSWLSDGQGCYYDFVASACRTVPNNCLSTVEAMVFLKDGLSKGRAWLKLALMEKRLTVYLSAALQQHSLVRSYYHGHAILLSEDMNMLMQDLLGLSAVDFSFFLKDDAICSKELMIVDLAPYLRFHQCAESVLSDIQEARGSASPVDSACVGFTTVVAAASAVDWEEKFNALQKQHEQVCKQKAFLEEMCRQKGRQLDDCQLRVKQLCQRMTQDAAAWASERRRLERLVARMHLDTLATAEIVLDNGSESGGSVSNKTTCIAARGTKDDSQSLLPLIGSPCSKAHAAAAKTEHGSLAALDSSDDVAPTRACSRNAHTSPTNKSAGVAFSGYNSDAVHTLMQLAREAYSTVVLPPKASADTEIGDPSFVGQAENRCIQDSAVANRTGDHHHEHADMTAIESDNMSAAVLSLLDTGPPPMSRCLAFISGDESEEAPSHSQAIAAVDVLSTYTLS